VGASQSATKQTNVLYALTSFIGRGQEMAVVSRLLVQTRLMTLTGSGGSGKTRLAIQIATSLSESFIDGVWLVTPREREVAALIAAGHTNRVIATELAISERTVDTHAARIFAKLGLTSRTQMRWE
jgi:DNA-binding CsgD family transcriptional regulator